MVPGLGFLYSGLSRRKNALSLLWAVVFSNAVVTFQWYFWGYSLAFSKTATNGFIGDSQQHMTLVFINSFPLPYRQSQPYWAEGCPRRSFPRFPPHSRTLVCILSTRIRMRHCRYICRRSESSRLCFYVSFSVDPLRTRLRNEVV